MIQIKPLCFVLFYKSVLQLLSPKLKTGYRYENQFLNSGFTNEVRQFCGYQYLCDKLLFYLVSSYSQSFFESLKSKSTQILRPPQK